MKRIVAVVLATALALLVVPTAQTTPKAAAAVTVADGVIFNNIITSKAAGRRLVTHLDRAIDGAPRGSVISMAMYLFDMESTTNKLIAAYRRGVHVQILIDDGTNTKEIRRLRSVLGTRKAGAASFVNTCRRGCMSNVPGSVIHAKLYLFSQTGTKRNVSLLSSANPHYVNTHNSWNNTHTITDAKIYNFMRRYFLDMRTDRTNHAYYRTAASGKNKVYLFPRTVRSPADIAILDVLNHTSCRGAAKGYGSNGRTVIRVGMWGWTAARVDIARRLWAMHHAGCKVDVILNSGRTGDLIMRTLLKRSSRYGKIRVYDAWYDGNNNNVAGRYIHHKLVMINGKWYGDSSTKVVYTGSQNFTSTGTLYNNDLLLRVIDGRTYNAYNSNMNYIRERKTRRITNPPNARSGGRAVDPGIFAEQYLDR